jgi:hypothetical protein
MRNREMKYKTLAVAVGSVILFAGCNDSLIFKRLEKTEEWLEAAETELESTKKRLVSAEAELASLQVQYDHSQTSLKTAEHNADLLAAKNRTLAEYKNRRESEDRIARIKAAEAAKVEKLLGTWKSKDTKVMVVISRPRDFYGPLTANNLSVNIRVYSLFGYRWESGVKVSLAGPNHIKIQATPEEATSFTDIGRPIYIDKHYQFKLSTLGTCEIWNSSGGKGREGKQTKLTKVSS